ncbi:MAG: helix-turn-helix domain-containing protein [Elusimicrobiota bacterium]
MIEPRLLKADEAAQYLNYHYETLYELARRGEIPAVKVGRSVRFDRLELDKWVDKKIAESHEEALKSPWSYKNRF